MLRHRGHRDRLDTAYLTLQILDFEDIGQKLYRLPWAPVEGQPEAEQWARYAPERIADMFSTSLRKVMGEAEMRQIGAQRLEASVRDTIGKPIPGLWWPMVVAWCKKPNNGMHATTRNSCGESNSH